VTTLDLRTLRLRPGEVRRETLDVEIEPFVLGGQRYESTPGTIPVELEISQASGATVFDLRLRAHLNGACMRCLGFAELEREVVAREFHDPDAPASDELRSDYVVSDQLQVSTWARDALVFVRSTPRVTAGGDRQAATTDGWVTYQLAPNGNFPKPRNGFNVQFFVKAYRSGDPALAGIAAYRLVQVPLASG